MSITENNEQITAMICERIRATCEDKGVSRDELQKTAQITPRRMRRIWAGKDVYLNDFMAIAVALDTIPSDLMPKRAAK